MNKRDRRREAHDKNEKGELPNVLLIEMDGVLIDSSSILFEVYEEFLQKHGHKGSKNEFNSLTGLSLPELLSSLTEQYGLRKSLEGLLEQYQNLLTERYRELSLMPQLIEALEEAVDLGLTLGVISSIGNPFATHLLKEKQLLEIIDKLVTIQEIHPENIPNLYQHALTLLGVEAEDAIAIVSSQQGIAAVRECDLSLWMFETRHPMNKGDIYFKDWKAILEHLGAFYHKMD